jgi:hypothetical protein
LTGRVPNAPPTWENSATVAELREFAHQRLSTYIAAFEAAHDHKDDAMMQHAVRGIRQIATRMDQFRRVALRRWLAAAPAQTQAQETHK